MSMGKYYGKAPIEFEGYTLGLERMSEMLPEIRELHAAHWDETEVLYLEDPLDPDYVGFQYLESQARLLCFTVRDNNMVMVGNAMYVLGHSLHMSGKLQAKEDTFFLAKGHRGGGLAGAFLVYIESYLRGLGVEYMGMSDKSPCGGKSLARLMEANGFKQIAVYYTKKIARGGPNEIH